MSSNSPRLICRGDLIAAAAFGNAVCARHLALLPTTCGQNMDMYVFSRAMDSNDFQRFSALICTGMLGPLADFLDIAC